MRSVPISPQQPSSAIVDDEAERGTTASFALLLVDFFDEPLGRTHARAAARADAERVRECLHVVVTRSDGLADLGFGHALAYADVHEQMVLQMRIIRNRRGIARRRAVPEHCPP